MKLGLCASRSSATHCRRAVVSPLSPRTCSKRLQAWPWGWKRRSSPLRILARLTSTRLRLNSRYGRTSVATILHAADFINAGGFDVVSLQHEVRHLRRRRGVACPGLLERLRQSRSSRHFTVLSTPDGTQRHIIDTIASRLTQLIVMAEKGREILLRTHAVTAEKVTVIAHGIPDFAYVEPLHAKQRLGFADRTVILTFGLLSPNKGIEVMIDAMPAVLAARPNAVYVVLGATHPNLVRDHGETYRQALIARVERLGISESVVFLDRFVDRPELLEYISMCDVYVTPYLNQAQMTSGTLAYSFGLGRAVVSTPTGTPSSCSPTGAAYWCRSATRMLRAAKFPGCSTMSRDATRCASRPMPAAVR